MARTAARPQQHLQLVLLEPRPLLRKNARGLRELLEVRDHVLAGAALGADAVCPARVVALRYRPDLQDAAQAGGTRVAIGISPGLSVLFSGLHTAHTDMNPTLHEELQNIFLCCLGALNGYIRPGF